VATYHLLKHTSLVRSKLTIWISYFSAAFLPFPPFSLLSLHPTTCLAIGLHIGLLTFGVTRTTIDVTTVEDRARGMGILGAAFGYDYPLRNCMKIPVLGGGTPCVPLGESKYLIYPFLETWSS
jgi:hypothetical protein